MKKLITYSLLAIALYTFNYKAISYNFKLFNSSAILIQDYDCEEKNQESQKSGEKDEQDEKKDFLEDTFFNKIYTLVLVNQVSFIKYSKLLFITSDYSTPVYSPPEQAVI